MNLFFNLKIALSLLRFVFFCCNLCLSLNLLSQTTVELSRQSVGLTASNSIMVRQSFQLIPKDDYAYIAIHGDKTGFKILEDNNWKPISNQSLAEWIAAKRAYDGKTLVLLSCNDSTSTQNLATTLGNLDKTAKRTTRPIIGWSQDVVLFTNGYIEGYGVCQKFSPIAVGATQPPKPILLTGKQIPIGRNSYVDECGNSDCVVLSNDPIDLRKQVPTGVNLTKSIIHLKNRYPNLYKAFTDDLKLFAAWVYLKKVMPSSKLTNNSIYLDHVKQIQNRYLDNLTDFKENERIIFKTQFENFLTTSVNKEEDIINLLFLDPQTSTKHTILTFQAAVTTAAKGQTLAQFLKNNNLEKSTDRAQKIGVLKSTEPNLAAFLEADQEDINISRPLLDLMNQHINNATISTITLLKDARARLTDRINQLMGQYLDIYQFRRVTASTNGFINEESSRGSIFESWVEDNHFQVIPKINAGKLQFHFDVTTDAQKNEVRTPVDLPTEAKILKTRYIDCSYKSTNGKSVGVEIKHVQQKLEGDPFKQLQDNGKLVAVKKLLMIEYVFSSQAVANANLSVFLKVFPDLTDKGKVYEIYYIDSDGAKLIL